MKSIRRAFRCAWLIAVFFVAAQTSANEARLIQLQHRSAADVIPLIQPLLGPNDAITGTDYRLIVRTSDKNFREIERLLAQLDTRRRQLRITVKQTAERGTNTSSTGISGEAGNDNVRIRIPRQAPSDNRGAFVQRDGVRLETRQTRMSSSDSSTQFVSTLEGTPAFVRVGQSFPHVQRILLLTGKQQTLLAQGVSLHNIVTGFDVTPHMQGENVLLQITPRLSSLHNPTTGLVNFQEYSTTVIVKPGEWVDIGGLTGTGDEVRRTILESGATQTSETGKVLLKVE